MTKGNQNDNTIPQSQSVDFGQDLEKFCCGIRLKLGMYVHRTHKKLTQQNADR